MIDSDAKIVRSWTPEGSCVSGRTHDPSAQNIKRQRKYVDGVSSRKVSGPPLPNQLFFSSKGGGGRAGGRTGTQRPRAVRALPSPIQVPKCWFKNIPMLAMLSMVRGHATRGGNTWR